MGKESTVDPNETAEQKLLRLASYRVTKAIERINQIGNLANYKPTEEQVKKICDALYGAVEGIEKRMLAQSNKSSRQGFTL